MVTTYVYTQCSVVYTQQGAYSKAANACMPTHDLHKMLIELKSFWPMRL